MGHFFFDIETYQSTENPDSSLNPYHTQSKVIVISYNYYPTFKPPTKQELKPPTFLKEWESNEKDLLSTFYKTLCAYQEDDTYLKFYGFNITKFDLPYLFGRMKITNIASEKNLYDVLFKPFGFDMYYLSSIISEKTREREQFWGISHKDVSRFFNLQVKEGTGDECSRFYDSKKYDKIMKYCTEEFNFEQLLNAFYLYVLDITAKSKTTNQQPQNK